MASDTLAIAVDLGGTQVRAALVDTGGIIHNRAAVKTEAKAGPQAVLAQIVALVGEMSTPDVQGIGVASPGPLDTITGTALNLPTLKGFINFPLKAELQKRFALPVTLENDGIAAAIGEWRFGAGRGHDNLVYVTVSTGIGGGVIADGRVLRGRKGMAGHIGHMILVPGGDLCNCGNKGCFEAYGAGPAFMARSRAQSVSGDVFASAAEHNPAAMALVKQEGEILGTGFTSLAHLYSPDVFIMGGGVSKGFAHLYPHIRAKFESSAMPAFQDVAIVAAALGDNAGLVGMASEVLRR